MTSGEYLQPSQAWAQWSLWRRERTIRAGGQQMRGRLFSQWPPNSEFCFIFPQHSFFFIFPQQHFSLLHSHILLYSSLVPEITQPLWDNKPLRRRFSWERQVLTQLSTEREKRVSNSHSPSMFPYLFIQLSPSYLKSKLLPSSCQGKDSWKTRNSLDQDSEGNDCEDSCGHPLPGLGLSPGSGLLPAWVRIQATAFLSRSSHSIFWSLPWVCSQTTARTVAQPEESTCCTIDRDFPEDSRLGQEAP